MVRELWQAMQSDHGIAVYVLLALVCGFVCIVWEISSYFFDRWRARRRARNVIQFRRHPRQQSVWAVFTLNVRDRMDDSRERYKHWRHGDRLVGDELLERFKGLR